MSNMFEQPLYEFEPVAAPLSESDLFHDYEIKSWFFSSGIFKIIGLAAVANIIAILVVAQTSLLTTKGCDSPLVGSVCQVLDTVYLGSLLFGTPREYVDVAYDRTDLADADITFIDVSRVSPKLYYPADYSTYANPPESTEPGMYEASVDDPPFIYPGIPNGMPTPYKGNSLFDTEPNYPKANPNAVDDNSLPPSINSYDGGYDTPVAKRRTRRGGRIKGLSNDPNDPNHGSPNSNLTAKVEPSASPSPAPSVEPAPTPDGDVKEDKLGVFINKRPLTDRAKETLDKLAANQIKLDATFKVGVTGTLGLAKDGKTVVLKNAKPILPDGVQNHPAIQTFVQDWITSLGDSGWLGYIEILDKDKKIKDKRVKITIEQSDADFVATVVAELPDENIAKTFASSLNVIIQGSIPLTDGDERTFLEAATTPTSNGNSLILNFKFQKPVVQEMIQRKLAELKAQPKKENGNANNKPIENKANQ